LILNTTDELPRVATYTAGIGSSLFKAVSMNKKCLFFRVNAITTQLSLYDIVEKRFLPTDNGIDSTLFSGIDLPTASIDISNDCLAVRVNDKVFHTDLWTTK
jgi:hypothetical protein